LARRPALGLPARLLGTAQILGTALSLLGAAPSVLGTALLLAAAPGVLGSAPILGSPVLGPRPGDQRRIRSALVVVTISA
jgi:hypothetical protein